MFFLPLLAYAQLPSQRGYFEDDENKKPKIDVDRNTHFGLYAGMMGSGVAGNQQGNVQFRGFNRLGMAIGAFVNSPLDEHWDFQMELMFIQKGARESVPDDPAAAAQSNNARLAINNLEIPIGVRYHIFLSDNVQSLSNHLSVDFMISPGFVLYQAQKDRQTDWQPTNFNSFQLNSVLGINYHLNKNIILGFRWNNSLTPIQSQDLPAGTATVFQQIFGTGLRSQTLGFQFFYAFN
jgi:hypothetical protein